MDQKESFYEHVAEWREQGRRIGTRPSERGGKAPSGRFLDDCVDASQAQETQEPTLGVKWRQQRLAIADVTTLVVSHSYIHVAI